jgi:hypothetical protein
VNSGYCNIATCYGNISNRWFGRGSLCGPFVTMGSLILDHNPRTKYLRKTLLGNLELIILWTGYIPDGS